MKKVLSAVILLTGISTSLMTFADLAQMQKDCESGDGKACYNLGLMYSNGQGVRQDYAKAAELFGMRFQVAMAALYLPWR